MSSDDTDATVVIRPCFKFDYEGKNKLFENIVLFPERELCVCSNASTCGLLLFNMNTGCSVREIKVFESPENSFYCKRINSIEKWKDDVVLVNGFFRRPIINGYCIKTGNLKFHFKDNSVPKISKLLSIPEDDRIVFSNGKELGLVSYSSMKLLDVNFLNSITASFEDTVRMNALSRIVRSLSFENCFLIDSIATTPPEDGIFSEFVTNISVKVVNHRKQCVVQEFVIDTFKGLDFLGSLLTCFTTFLNRKNEEILVTGTFIYSGSKFVIQFLNMVTREKLTSVVLKDVGSSHDTTGILPIRNDHLIFFSDSSKHSSKWFRLFSMKENPIFEVEEIEYDIEMLEAFDDKSGEILLASTENYQSVQVDIIIKKNYRRNHSLAVWRLKISPLFPEISFQVQEDIFERIMFLKSFLEDDNYSRGEDENRLIFLEISLRDKSLGKMFKTFCLST